MIEQWSLSLARRLELGGAKASPAVLAYAIGVYLNIFLTLLLTLLGGFIFHTLTASLLCFALFSVIRLFSGGYHLQSLTACTLVSAGAFILIPHLLIPAGWTVFLTAVSLILFLLLAPQMDPKTTVLNPKYYPHLKIISLALTATNLLVQSDLYSMVLLLQALLLLPVAIRR